MRAPSKPLVEGFELRVILGGMDGSFGEGDLEIFVAVLAGAMAHVPVGVVGSRHETTVTDEVLVGDKAFDTIDFEIDGEGRELANAGDCQEVLNIIVGDQDRMQGFLQGQDLVGEGIARVFQDRELEAIGIGDLIGVELDPDAVDPAQTSGALLDQTESETHRIPEPSEFTADFMGSGDEVLAQEGCQGLGVNLIGLNFGIGNGFEILGVGQDELDAVLLQKVIEPVPTTGGLNDDNVRTRQ